MRRLSATPPTLAVAALLGAPAFAHHSMAMFDMSKGAMARFSPPAEACDPEVAERRYLEYCDE